MLGLWWLWSGEGDLCVVGRNKLTSLGTIWYVEVSGSEEMWITLFVADDWKIFISECLFNVGSEW